MDVDQDFSSRTEILKNVLVSISGMFKAPSWKPLSSSFDLKNSLRNSRVNVLMTSIWRFWKVLSKNGDFFKNQCNDQFCS
jgi:hypothetical protein